MFDGSLWPDEQIARLTQLWNEGKSGSQIAAIMSQELRMTFTRNKIIGKVHRLKLPQRASHNPPAKPRNAPNLIPYAGAAKRRRRFVASTVPDDMEIDIVPLTTAASDLATPIEQRRKLMELGNGLCRWPVGHPKEADFFFCGGEVLHDKPYCAAHCKRAFIKPRELSRLTKILASSL